MEDEDDFISDLGSDELLEQIVRQRGQKTYGKRA